MEWQEKTGAPAEYLGTAYDPKTKQAEGLVIKLIAYIGAFSFGLLFYYGCYILFKLSIVLWRTL